MAETKKKFDQNKYIQEYSKEHYVRIEIRCKPEIKEKLKEKADAAGMASLSQYLIKRGLEEDIKTPVSE